MHLLTSVWIHRLNGKYLILTVLTLIFFIKLHIGLFYDLALLFQRIIMARRYEIDDAITRQYKQYNAAGTQLTMRLLPPRIIVIL